jgi:hypothetical protein
VYEKINHSYSNSLVIPFHINNNKLFKNLYDDFEDRDSQEFEYQGESLDHEEIFPSSSSIVGCTSIQFMPYSSLNYLCCARLNLPVLEIWDIALKKQVCYIRAAQYKSHRVCQVEWAPCKLNNQDVIAVLNYEQQVGYVSLQTK